ncbi:MAG: SRPBCC family protein [Patulibacter minatonensis]
MPRRPQSAGPPPPRRGFRRTWVNDRITVDAPAGEVWAVLADIDAWPDWTPGLRAVRRRSGELVPGRTRFTMHIELGPLPVFPTPCVLYARDEADGRIEWGGGAPGTAIRHSFHVRALESGGAEIVHHEEATNALALLLWPLERLIREHDARWSAAIDAPLRGVQPRRCRHVGPGDGNW